MGVCGLGSLCSGLGYLFDGLRDFFGFGIYSGFGKVLLVKKKGKGDVFAMKVLSKKTILKQGATSIEQVSSVQRSLVGGL